MAITIDDLEGFTVATGKEMKAITEGLPWREHVPETLWPEIEMFWQKIEQMLCARRCLIEFRFQEAEGGALPRDPWNAGDWIRDEADLFRTLACYYDGKLLPRWAIDPEAV